MTSHPADLLAGMQHAVGIIAARHRGDLDGAHALAEAFTDDAQRAHAFLLLTELALTIVADSTDTDLQIVVRDISLRIAALAAAD
ncbi:superoxide dismutase [Micromonospora craniellae]|uniref:Superoxide dismutase n=1 Tax=Micromonospora craniellae TaxID=2294034 RepID=A0A372FRE0_9ACTN|nr:superoxide dismutase [Micromonospora craniellae]QOC91350.1 superoxide dismutase [Micromonospora craniellae]RFS43357.1 superoxide dismutase [Micromonospora craniellae]